jgi:hypothetical protein
MVTPVQGMIGASILGAITADRAGSRAADASTAAGQAAAAAAEFKPYSITLALVVASLTPLTIALAMTLTLSLGHSVMPTTMALTTLWGKLTLTPLWRHRTTITNNRTL